MRWYQEWERFQWVWTDFYGITNIVWKQPYYKNNREQQQQQQQPTNNQHKYEHGNITCPIFILKCHFVCFEYVVFK